MPTVVREIYLHNDFLEIAGPVTGRGEDGVREKYHSADVVFFITATSGSDTPIGGLSGSAPEIGETARYAVVFEAADIDDALGELADGTTVYRVVQSPGDFRVEDPLRVRTVRRTV